MALAIVSCHPKVIAPPPPQPCAEVVRVFAMGVQDLSRLDLSPHVSGLVGHVKCEVSAVFFSDDNSTAIEATKPTGENYNIPLDKTCLAPNGMTYAYGFDTTLLPPKDCARFTKSEGV
jgi:hypothetical protein